ncbi:DUF5667 domain-containing protein [Actinosynnema sp. NPDC047251]|uniref:DUF5667 domain-containing protein n=1 Tax=Saccharothrix espanaensis (strain ATCC 51144 / DSM 44229 / JCM 9112 / NBRC 15066 / NRRL 15764) TaxID=1179773 RepID=K0KEV9_SACES|nr:DUF5667 domain-containing protein [Saccharothrix espanaensis]CCH35309.1 hypothetical protein BN6_80920 [Saccharothrix espanaensis DSM 44229]
MVGRGITPLGRHRQREQFARAVDALPEQADPAFADELAVVALLRKAAVTSGPDEAAKARMRERVLNASPPPTAKIDSIRPRSGARGRLAVALAAALCLVFSLAGMSLLLSRDALPGDALYGVKRTAESASLGLTFGEESKGYKRLEFAAARISEIETLVDRYRDSGGGPLGGHLTALTDFDADAAAGSRVLAAHGTGSDGTGSDERTLGSLREWATSQTTRLGDLRDRLPAEAATRSGTSLDLLGRIAQRAADLAARSRCATVTTGEVDEVGPVPATGECSAPPIAPSPSATQPSGTSIAVTPTPAGPTTSTSAPAPTATAPAPGSGGTTPPTSKPGLPLPSVTVTVEPPVQLPSLPITLPPLLGLSG